MISAVAILMLCNGIRISLKSKKNTINEIGCVMEFMTHLFRFFIFFHRISRMNRRHSCLSDYSWNFADIWPLVNGLRPIYAPVVFCHADFADDADFSLWDYFVPQISQIYTDFSLWGLFRPTDFTDIHKFFFVRIILSHRFHRYTQIFLCEDYFVPQISQIYTDF